MNISITGASGFVGQNLQMYLNDSHDLNIMSVRYKPNQYFKINGDAIIHLAGKAHDLKKVSNPSDYYEANFELTKQLFDSFLKSEASVFIFMSTVKAVADVVEGILTEDAISNPKTHYGIAKQLAEKHILSHELPIGKRAYILRPCMIHGPGNKGNLNLLFTLVNNGISWPLGAYHNKRSFLSINNLMFVIQQLLEKDVASGVYNVSDDETLSTNELIKLIGLSQNKNLQIWNLSKTIINFFAKIGDQLRLPLNSERLQKLTESYVVSNYKIKNALGIKKMPVTSEEGLINTFNSFKITNSHAK